MSASDHSLSNISAGLASVLVAAVLVGLKLWALGETGALSVAASLADSAMDLMVSLGATAALIYAARPPDEAHAFGNTAAEDEYIIAHHLFPTHASCQDNIGMGRKNKYALWKIWIHL